MIARESEVQPTRLREFFILGKLLRIFRSTWASIWVLPSVYRAPPPPDVPKPPAPHGDVGS